jgi:CubicO group peptidase (beta-lactamase class C family)
MTTEQVVFPIHTRWRALRVWGYLALLLLAALQSATAPAAEPEPSTAMVGQASHFWQTVAAKPDERGALLRQHFSPALRERKGEADLLETFASLAEVLGGELSTAVPTVAREDGAEGELHYTLPDGRRVALLLTLSDSDPPRIDRFGVRPLPPEVSAVPRAQLSATIAARVQAEAEAGRFAGAVLVAQGDTQIHAQAIGLANRRSARAITLDTPINLGSINKMFTAIAIAQLQAAGKLDWQDTVGRHLPDFPNATIRDRVTIHQLLTHTSGVGSYWNEAYTARKDRIVSQQDFLDTFIDDPLRFEPGKGLEYSNGGPVILGLIIEAVSGLDYYDYVRERIYGPADMRHADHYRRDDTAAGFARGYMKGADGQWQDNEADLGLRGSAAGGGYASAQDLLAFSRALSSERLLLRAQLETLWTAHTQPGPIGYGYLFSVGNTAGHRWVGHDGGAPGISAEFLHYPDDGLAIIVLANQDNAAAAMREWLHALVEASLFGKP